MCGITAIVPKSSAASTPHASLRHIMNSLVHLQNRGYDSIGVGYTTSTGGTGERIQTQKTCDLRSENTEAFFEITNNDVAACSSHAAFIGHTRWATHGGRVVRNAHPHVSTHGAVSIVHNGIIENYADLKRSLERDGWTFKSETDSEVVANCIERELERTVAALERAVAVDDVFKAIAAACALFVGTYGLGIVCVHHPRAVFLTKHGSPILIGENERALMATSEAAGFSGEVNYYYPLESKEIVAIHTDRGVVQYASPIAKRKLTYVETERTAFTPDPFPHWTIREIIEQPLTLMQTINNGARIFHDRVHLGGLGLLLNDLGPSKRNHVVLLGCGTSHYASLCAQHYFKEIEGVASVSVHDAAEFSVADLPRLGCAKVSGTDEKYLVFLCSQSGETMDLQQCIHKLRRIKQHCITIGVVNVVDSQIARDVDCGVYTNAGREVSVASTKSFVSQLLVYYMVYVWLQSHSRPIGTKDHASPDATAFQRHKTSAIRLLISQIGQLATTHRFACTHPNTPSTAYDRYNLSALDRSSLFVLGLCKMAPVAKECALKFKEMCYIHAEGFHASTLKHGPFALLEPRFPVVLLVDKANQAKIMNTYEELVSRDAFVYIVTDCEWLAIDPRHEANTHIVRIPHNAELPEILFAHAMQFLAYLIAVRRGINPDRPRNLAKVVTVE